MANNPKQGFSSEAGFIGIRCKLSCEIEIQASMSCAI